MLEMNKSLSRSCSTNFCRSGCMQHYFSRKTITHNYTSNQVGLACLINVRKLQGVIFTLCLVVNSLVDGIKHNCVVVNVFISIWTIPCYVYHCISLKFWTNIFIPLNVYATWKDHWGKTCLWNEDRQLIRISLALAVHFGKVVFQGKWSWHPLEMGHSARVVFT